MRYYMINKPSGYVSARHDEKFPAVLDIIPNNEGLHLSGRLDRDAEGLIIATDDGDLTFRLTRPEFGIPKTYYFKAFGKITDDDIKRVNEGGLPLGDGSFSKKAEIVKLSDSKVIENENDIPEDIRPHCMRNPNGNVVTGKITVSEGKFHEVKQILHDIGCRIFVLKRLSIGEILLDDRIPSGGYRELNYEEIKICEKYRSLYIEL